MTTTAVAPLTTADAEALVTAAVEAAEKAGVTVSVTVLDAGGHLLAFRRDDRAVLISGETSTRKAYTALSFRASTADLAKSIREGQLDPALARLPNVAMLGGGTDDEATGNVLPTLGKALLDHRP